MISYKQELPWAGHFCREITNLNKQWPNLKNLRGGLNLNRGLNMVGSTLNCIKCFKIYAGAKFKPGFGGFWRI